MAPEVFWSGTLDASADVYSLGLLLYAGVSGGRLPFYPDDRAPLPEDQTDALRRRIREIFRLSQGKMKQGYDCIVVARTRAAHADYWELKRAFEKTCKKLDLWETQA